MNAVYFGSVIFGNRRNPCTDEVPIPSTVPDQVLGNSLARLAIETRLEATKQKQLKDSFAGSLTLPVLVMPLTARFRLSYPHLHDQCHWRVATRSENDHFEQAYCATGHLSAVKVRARNPIPDHREQGQGGPIVPDAPQE